MASSEPGGLEREEEEEEEEEYVVEHLLDYEVRPVDNLNKKEEGYDPTLGPIRYEPRYMVKWKDYDHTWATWEPRSSFFVWNAEYDIALAEIYQKYPGKGHPRAMEREAEKLNNKLRSEWQAKKAAKGKGRGAAKREELHQSSTGSSTRLRSTSAQAAPTPATTTGAGRSSRTSTIAKFDLPTYLAESHISSHTELASLRPDTPPRRHRSASRSSSVSSEEVPLHQAATGASNTAASGSQPVDNIFAVDDDVDLNAGMSVEPPSPQTTALQPLPAPPKPKRPSSATASTGSPSTSTTTLKKNKPKLQSSLSSSTSERPIDHFNIGRHRSEFDAKGDVPLNLDHLEMELPKLDFLRTVKPPTSMQDIDPSLQSLKKSDVLLKIFHAWGIPNLIDNVGNFEETFRGRECFIYAPKKDATWGQRKLEQSVWQDYTALQYVLARYGLKQVAHPGSSTTAVFIHVEEEEEIGKFYESEGEGPLGWLENWRERKQGEVVFMVFGTKVSSGTEGAVGSVKKERTMRQIWSVQAAITTSPAAFSAEPEAIVKVFRDTTESRRLFPGRRDKFPWIPANYITKGGPFYIPPKRTAERDELARTQHAETTMLLHSLLLDHTLSLAQLIPLQTKYEGFSFPVDNDVVEYKEASLRRVEEDFLALCAVLARTDVEWLQNRIRVWRSFYGQIRRWIVIVTPEEKAKTPKVAGIELLTLAEMEDFLAH